MKSKIVLIIVLFILATISLKVSAQECQDSTRPQATNADELAKIIFQENFGKGYGNGTVTLDYLECYGEKYLANTGLKAHAGVDFRAALETAVYTPVSGRVIYSCSAHETDKLGKLAIRAQETEDEAGYTIFFLHLSSCLVKEGDYVLTGERIGNSGEKGTCYINEQGIRVCEPHLHVEVQAGLDVHPCGESGTTDDPNACPFSQLGTETSTIASATRDPLSSIISVTYIRTTDQYVNSSQVNNNDLIIRGLNFGTSAGTIVVETPIQVGSNIKLGKREVGAITSWTDNEIRAELLPGQFTNGVTSKTFSGESLIGPLLVHINRPDEQLSSSLAFPFKDSWRREPWEIQDDWWLEPLLWLWNENVLEGYTKTFPWFPSQSVSTGFFGILDPVTTGEFLKLLERLNGLRPTATCACANTDWMQHWARPFMCLAEERSWGISCDDDPDSIVSRGFAAKIMAEFAGIPDTYTPPTSSPFNDLTTAHTYYREIAFCKNNGIFSGYTDGTFRPDNNLMRIELAKILKEAY